MQSGYRYGYESERNKVKKSGSENPEPLCLFWVEDVYCLSQNRRVLSLSPPIFDAAAL